MTGHFTALLHNARELCQLDYRGEIVPQEQQTKFCSEVPIQCVTDDRTIDVGFLLGYEVELSRIKKLLEDERLAAVVRAGAKETIPRLAKYGPWKLYDFNLTPLSGSGPIRLPADSYELKQDEELSEVVAKELAEATERHRNTAAAFERAKKFLESNLDYLRNYPVEARSAARFLADCMGSDAAPFMGSWNREKAGSLIDEVEDLIHRRNPNHPGYRSAAESVSGILYTIKAPMFWAKYPPQPQLLRL